MDQSIHDRLGVLPSFSEPNSKLGVSQSALAGDWPMHGLRHRPGPLTNGWFIWSGEYSDVDDFFVPLHVEHVESQLPAAAPYLALPPGYRFLIAPGHEDVWFDATLLDDDVAELDSRQTDWAIDNLASARSHLDAAGVILTTIWDSPHDEDDRRYDAVDAELAEAGSAINAELGKAGGEQQAAELLDAELKALEESLPPRFD
jgi:hypothetical protein